MAGEIDDINFNDNFPNPLDSENDDSDNDNEKENNTKEESETSIRLRSALFYNLGKMVELETKKENKTFTKEYLACLNEVVCQQMSSFASDVEMFSKHGKRTNVNMDDVKLIARKNESLLKSLNEHAKVISDSKGKGKKRKADAVVICDWYSLIEDTILYKLLICCKSSVNLDA